MTFSYAFTPTGRAAAVLAQVPLALFRRFMRAMLMRAKRELEGTPAHGASWYERRPLRTIPLCPTCRRPRWDGEAAQYCPNAFHTAGKA